VRVVLLALAMGVLGVAQTSPAEEKVQAGLRAQRTGNLPKAVESFADAVRLDPKLPPARVYLGAALLARGKTAAAIEQLERASELSPEDPGIRLQLAAAYERAGNLLAAVAQLKKGAELAPNDPEFAYQLGRAYLRLSEWSVERMKSVNPRSARVYQVLGESYSAQGATEKALDAFEKAARAEPGLSGTHLAMAYLYARARKPAEALREIDRELAIAPGSIAALNLKKQLSGQP